MIGGAVTGSGGTKVFLSEVTKFPLRRKCYDCCFLRRFFFVIYVGFMGMVYMKLKA